MFNIKNSEFYSCTRKLTAIIPLRGIRLFVLLVKRLDAGLSTRSGAGPCEICGRQRRTETGFSLNTSVSPVNIIQQCSIFIFIHVLLLPEGQTGEAWKASKATLFRKMGIMG
jgi:hypothetical protein